MYLINTLRSLANFVFGITGPEAACVKEIGPLPSNAWGSIELHAIAHHAFGQTILGAMDKEAELTGAIIMAAGAIIRTLSRRIAGRNLIIPAVPA